MLSEAIIGAIAEAVIGYVLEQSGLGDHLRTALGRDPVKRAYARALRAAMQAIEESQPQLAGRLFDASFLQHEARPVLAPLLWRHGRPTSAQLATAWADSLGLEGKTRDDALADMTPMADGFLAVLEDAAMKQDELQEVFNHRAAERTANASERTANHTAALPQILDILQKRPLPSGEIAASGAEMPAETGRLERLDEMALLSRARCIERWQAAGLSRDAAIALADDPTVGAPKPEYQPTEQRPLLVLVAELGAGKSLIAERLFQYAVSLANASPGAPVPVFLKARDCVGRLRQVVLEQAEGLGDVRRQGATVIVDGADETGGSAEGVLSDCRILVNFWPHTTVVLTGRPSPAFCPDVCRERVNIEPLSDEESTSLIRRLSGDQHFNLFEWPESVRDAIHRPLFAILLSGYLQNPQDRKPRSTGELLHYLVERSLGRANANRISSDLLLQRLATLSTNRAGGFVPANEIGTKDEIQALLDSRLVVERGGAIGFPLALLAEWFAAHSLANGIPDPADLVNNRARLERWRYPLVMFVALFDAIKLSDVLEKLAQRHPAFTSTILSEASPKWENGGEAGPLSAEEWGSRVRTAMQAWAKGIGPIAKLIAPVSQVGELRPLGIRGDSSRLVLGWYHGPQQLPGITSFSLQDQRSQPLDWPFVASMQPGQHPAWAWRWTRDSLRDKLTQLLRARVLPLADGPLARERVWQISQAMAGHGSHWEHPIPLQEIESNLNRTGENTTLVLRGGVTLRPPEVDWYRRQIANLRSSGLTAIEPPYPGPDQEVSGASRFCDEYSDEQLLQRTQKVFGAAIEGYRQLVATWLPAFESELVTATLLPARLVGALVPPSRVSAGQPHGPVLHWYWLPLERDKQSSVQIQLWIDSFRTDNHFEIIRTHIQRFRHEAANWLTVSMHHGDASKILAPNPATQLAYEWLQDDLRRISWVGQ